MGTVNINLAEAQNLNLPLGLQLENEVTEVVFDFSAWQTAYGSGDLGLSIQRPGDSQPYAGELTIDGTDATWTVSSLDIAYKGVGEIQLTYTVGTVVKKSVIYKFTVYKSLGANGEYPSPGQTWQEEIEDDITDLRQDLSDLDDRVEALEQGGGTGGGLTEEAKEALLACFENVAWIGDDGLDYYNALANALNPPKNLSSITCIYTQSGAVYTTDSLDVLKDDLVVTAHYDDSSTATVTTYTLSGTLTAGTSTITVSYNGKTTTFNVTVTAALAENFVKVNSPVINNKILEKSSTNVGYIRTNEVFSPETSSWNIKFRIKKATGGVSFQDILDTVDSSNAHIRSLLYEFLNTAGAIYQYLASSGSGSWDIQSGTSGRASLTDNVWYYLDCYYDGTNTYGIKTSTDGEEWTDYNFTSSKYIAGGGYLAFGRSVNGEFNGEIDLSTLEIYIDGDLWWQAYGTPKAVTSISAVYTQGGTVYTTDSLDSLKSDLVVTATYDDSSTAVIASNKYTLSGTLTAGTSVITVSYGGKTTTFNVTVTEAPSVLTGYTEVGSPTITDNILTVADGKFVKTNIPFAPSSDPWEVIIKYRKTEALGGYTDLIGTVDSSNASGRGFLFELNNGTGTAGSMFASSNGSSWDITASGAITTLPEPTSWVWISMSFTGTAYVTKTSTDGETWTTQKEIASTTPIYDDSYAVGFGLKRNGVLKGEIDLTGCMIYKNGNLWWKAV